uniref:Uncharacterized protein n=1 Tax=Timema cristinae TaxID=61476 RepID=A0A7R9DJN8_TIMCR|nr:unnamed protein product [Timema cristinae]
MNGKKRGREILREREKGNDYETDNDEKRGNTKTTRRTSTTSCASTMMRINGKNSKLDLVQTKAMVVYVTFEHSGEPAEDGQNYVESVEDDIRRIHTDVVNSALKWGQVLKDYSLKKRKIMESLDAIEAKVRHSMSKKWALAVCGGDTCLSLSTKSVRHYTWGGGVLWDPPILSPGITLGEVVCFGILPSFLQASGLT